LAKHKAYLGKNYHREAAQAARQKPKTPPRWMCYGMRVNTSGIDFDDENQVDKLEETMMTLPSKGKAYYKNWDYRSQLDHLPAIRGLVKKFVGRTYDEFYSFVRASLDANSVSGIHILGHALEDVYFTFIGEDGELWGNSAASRIQNWSDTCNLNDRARLRTDNIYYVDDDGLIQIVHYKESPLEIDSKEGFFRALPGSVVKKYFIGPFYDNRPNPNKYKCAAGYGEDKIVFKQSDLPCVNGSDNKSAIGSNYWTSPCHPYYFDITQTITLTDYSTVTGSYTKSKVTKAKVVLMSDLFPS
jgi:hypothetical protein